MSSVLKTAAFTVRATMAQSIAWNLAPEVAAFADRIERAIWI